MYNSKGVVLPTRSCCTLVLFLPLLLSGVLLVVGCSAKSSRTFSDQSGDLSADITDFRSDSGEAIVSLFAVHEGFPDVMEKAWQNKRMHIKSGRAKAVFTSVPYGEYALCVLHDEDGDSRMKSGWLGQPLEGFGFSGRPDYKFGPPDFSDAAFLLVSGEREIVVRMRYETARKENQGARRLGQDGKR